MQLQIRAVAPEIPELEKWASYLQPAIDANWFTNFGPVNTNFEKRLAELFGCEGEAIVAVANATAGLSACLIANAVSSAVLCPAFTFQATASSILGAGCKPVIVDTDAVTGVMRPEVLEHGLRETGARAAIVLAPYGIATDFREHAEVCRRNGAILVIDNAAGLGVERAGARVSGDDETVWEVFSLHATKPFGIGEGGVVFAPSTAEARLRSALNFGLPTHTLSGDDKRPYWGINGKLSEFHAAVGMAVADTMAQRVSLRQVMARKWIEAVQDLPVEIFCSDVHLCPWQVFPVLLKNEEQVQRTVSIAADRGIELRRYYAPSLGRCSGMAALGPCPNAAELAARALVLPMRSWIEEDEQSAMIEKVSDCLRRGAEGIHS